MNKQGKKYTGIAAVVVFLLCALFCIPFGTSARANSAQRYWNGVTASGTQIVGEDCPLEVEHENLTFEIPVFPANYYHDSNDFSQYNASVTAEYTFYNPADYEVHAALAFPFGVMPYYIMDEQEPDDSERYCVTADGVAVERNLRHTLYSGDFETSADLERLRDECVKDDFFTDDLLITAYSFCVEGISAQDAREYAPYAATTIGKQKNTFLMASDHNGFGRQDKNVTIGFFAHNGDSITVYAVGEPLAAPPAWEMYSNGALKKKIGGTLRYKGSETFTFGDIVMGSYNQDGDVSRIDWYNAVLDNLNGILSRTDFYLGNCSDVFNVSRSLLQWYTYNLIVPARSRVVNAVTAPLYPSIDAYYEPPVYEYTYLLSPAKTWNTFGTLDIEIRTPYYLLESGGYDFTPTENGFALSLTGLPDGELKFTLCADQNPKSVHMGCSCGTGSALADIVLISAGVLVLAVLSWLVSKMMYGI